jgi:hypothetical protein
MSTLALPARPVSARLAGLPPAWLVVALGSGLALVLRELSVDAFVWWTTLGFAALCVRSFVYRRNLDAGDAILLFTMYYALSLLVRGIGLLSWVDSPYLVELGDKGTAHFRELVGWSQLYSGLGLFALQEGYGSSVAPRWAAAVVRRLPSIAAPWRTSRVTRVAAGLVLLGVIGAVMRVHDLGGFMRAASNPMAAGTDEALGHWWQIALTEFAVVGFHVHVLRLLLGNDRRFLRHYLVLGLGLCGPIYLVSGSKFLLLRTLFAPWLYRHIVVRRVSFWHVVAAFAIFSALFPLFYAYRALGLTQMWALGAWLANDTEPLMHVFNRAYGSDSFMLILQHTGVTLPFRWGSTLADLGTFWIPRALWLGKPDSFGLEFPALYMPDVRWGSMTYVSTSLPGELYLNFHVAGVLAGSWLLGAAMRTGRVLTTTGPGGILLYGYMFIVGIHLVEGCIASQFETLLTEMLPAMLALAFLTARARSGQRDGARA